MISSPEATYVPASRAVTREVLRALQNDFRTRRERTPTTLRTYLDTFDWRLQRHGGTLSATRTGDGWWLEWRAPDGALRRRSRTAELPAWADDLAGTAHAALAEVIEPRRLLSVVREEVGGETVAVLDRRAKTVVRIRVEAGRASADGARSRRIPERIRVCAMRGYPAQHAEVLRWLEARRGLERHAAPALDRALALLGLRPGSYSSKLDLRLDRDARADEAVRTILRALLQTIRANEDGARRNLDVEFLHDLRVAVRRTRSGLGQLRGALDAGVIEPYRQEFAWLGRLTGPTRDLDVHLLDLRTYREQVPAALLDGLRPLEEFLIERHRVEQRRLARALGSERYHTLVRGWERVLRARAAGTAGPDAARPIVEVASERIRRAYRKLRRRGRLLDESTPRETVHRLRIEAKKLRYLLEFFRSLYDPASAAALVRALKRLQDVLGDFNDAGIQQAELRALAGELSRRDGVEVDTLLAIGALVGRLDERERVLRAKLTPRVHEFVADGVRETVRGLR